MNFSVFNFNGFSNVIFIIELIKLKFLSFSISITSIEIKNENNKNEIFFILLF